MKTMMSVDGNRIIRVTDEKASELYTEGFRYVPKSMWKEQVRDTEQKTEDKSTKEKNNKMSKSTKRHLKKSKNK
tara:strand:- start:48 stop:269 length:222 start_codon:yes stop_codon:yes gene_type:complete